MKLPKVSRLSEPEGMHGGRLTTGLPRVPGLISTWMRDRGFRLTNRGAQPCRRSTPAVGDPAKPCPLRRNPDDRGTPVHGQGPAIRLDAAGRPSLPDRAPERRSDDHGPVTANLHVSTSGTNSDFVVEPIDVNPGTHRTRSQIRRMSAWAVFRCCWRETSSSQVSEQLCPILNRWCRTRSAKLEFPLDNI